MADLKFTVGSAYRCRNGRKAVCVWIFSSGRTAFAAEGLGDCYIPYEPEGCAVWLTHADGRRFPHIDDTFDIVAEWKDCWKVLVAQRLDGTVVAFVNKALPAGCRLLAQHEIRRGDGL